MANTSKNKSDRPATLPDGLALPQEQEIEKAILVSDIGITPTNDGKAIRLNFPDLTEERRKEFAMYLRNNGGTI